MNTLGGSCISNIQLEKPTTPGGLATLTILDNKVENFYIIHDWRGNSIWTTTTSVDEYDMDYSLMASPSPAYNVDEISVTFSVIKDGNITLSIYDVLGNEVGIIASGYYPSGQHTLTYNLQDIYGTRLSSASYTIRLRAGMEIKNFPLVISY